MKFTLRHWKPIDDGGMPNGPSRVEKILVIDESCEVVAYWERRIFPRELLSLMLKRKPNYKPRMWYEAEFFSESYSEQDLLLAIGIGPAEMARASAVPEGDTFLAVALKAQEGHRPWACYLERPEIELMRDSNSTLEFEI